MTTDPKTDSVLTFPCEFPVKVLGKSSETFETAVLAIFKTYFPTLSEGSLKQRISQQGKYLALTITVKAESQKQLDDLYRALSSNPEVIMAL